MEWVALRLRRRFGRKRASRERDLVALLVKTVLSQNTNDLNRDRAFDSLRRAFPRYQDITRASLPAIEKAIRVAGLERQKALRLRQILSRLQKENHKLNLSFLCKMPQDQAREYLLSFKGVGMKTASVVLLFGCGMAFFPVDTHILRVTQRLGVVPARATAKKAHEILGAMVPSGLGYELHLNLIEHGRNICKSRKPDCPVCPLNRRCRYYHTVWLKNERAA